MKKYILKKFSNIWLIIILALTLRLILAPFFTYYLDQNTFISWSERLFDFGYQGFYKNTWSDYLPGYLYILRLLPIFQSVISNDVVLYKLPAIIAETLLVGITYLIVKKHFSKKAAVLSSALIAFNPAIFANSTLWGQVDILTIFFPLIAIYLLDKNIALSAIALAAGGLVKPQAAMAVPFILALMLKEKWRFKKIVLYGTVALIILLVGFLPFKGSDQSLFSFVFDRINVTLGQYQYSSVNAFNFWGIWGFWKDDTKGFISTHLWGNIIVTALAVTIFYYQLRSKIKYNFLSLSLYFFISFFFLTRMHERHLLPALIPLSIYAGINKKALIPLGGFSLIYLLNLKYGYMYLAGTHAEFSSQLIILLIIFGLILLLNLFVFYIFKKDYLWLIIKNYRETEGKREKIKDYFSQKASRRILFLILAFSLIVRLNSLAYPKKDYFDEIYHAFTARQILESDPEVWDWQAVHPEGFAYEWTHPPLAKEIMAVSMRIFGINSFAWRLPGALLGVGSIFFVYAIAYALFKSRDIAIFSSLLISLDGLLLTMSRIGTADIYILFFVLGSYLYFLKDKHLFASVFLGLAAASKWSTLWFLPILAVSHLGLKKKFSFNHIFYFIIPPAIYLASYYPMFTHGFDLQHFWGMQKQMWWYHSGLEATHPYTSVWWKWPLMVRPVYLYQYVGNSLVGNIYALGNPAFFWFGLVSVLSVFISLIFKLSKNKKLAILLFAYLGFFVPWALSPRIMFIYHYLPSLPFMAILSGYILKKNDWVLVPILTVTSFLFVYFYPHWTGMHIPSWFADSYYWFSSWR